MSDGDHVKTFSGDGDFVAMEEMERFLRTAGFSIGSNQRGDPRGILFGDFEIAKWRNLNERLRKALHGYAQGNMRAGPIIIRIYGSAPAEAKKAFHQTAVAWPKREQLTS